MVTQLDHTSTIPLHMQAETVLRMLISSDIYKNGALLPKEVELAQMLGVSRNTLRQAINRLVFQGILIRKKGYGTIVAPQKMLSNARNWMSFSQEMRSLGYTVANFELHVSWKRPESAEICEFLNSPTDRPLVCLERLRGKTDKPFVYFISYFNPSVGLTGNENFQEPLYTILQRDYGIEVLTSKEEISAQAADQFIAGKLGINVDSPILVRKRLVYDIHDVPIEYNIGYYRSDCFTYTIEFKR